MYNFQAIERNISRRKKLRFVMRMLRRRTVLLSCSSSVFSSRGKWSGLPPPFHSIGRRNIWARTAISGRCVVMNSGLHVRTSSLNSTRNNNESKCVYRAYVPSIFARAQETCLFSQVELFAQNLSFHYLPQRQSRYAYQVL